MPGNPLQLGGLVGSGKSPTLAASARERHLYVCGGTGVGKSKFLEHCIRQDILNWTDSHCGLILFDPHGLVYQNIMAWLTRHGLKRPVIPIDLRRDDWIISYNLLRRRKRADPSVIVGNFVRALAHVWGEGGTDHTPLFARWAGIILLTLYQNGYTISDVMYLLSRDDIRRAMVAKLKDPAAIHAWQKAEQYPKEFESQILSTLNRFQRLSGPQVMKATFGQPDVSLDLLTALNEGKIILVNLSTAGSQIDEEDADTFATLMLTDLWAAAKDRPKQEREKTRPFYVYIDECQNFITPTIAKNLDQARGYGLHLTLANQFPSQFLNAGQSGKAIYDSILANADNKVVFKLRHPDDAKTMARSLFMSVLDTDQVKHMGFSTKVVGYREETRQSQTVSQSKTKGSGSSTGGGSFHGQSEGDGLATSHTYIAGEGEDGALTSAEGWNSYVAYSEGESENWSESESTAESHGESTTTSSMLIPVMGREESSRQYRTIEEQLFRAEQNLFDQEDRHFAIRFHGGPKAPLFVKTPTVTPASTRKELVEKYRKKLLKKLAFALPMEEAVKRLDGREEKLLKEVVDIQSWDEPTTSKRRIK